MIIEQRFSINIIDFIIKSKSLLFTNKSSSLDNALFMTHERMI